MKKILYAFFLSLPWSGWAALQVTTQIKPRSPNLQQPIYWIVSVNQSLNNAQNMILEPPHVSGITFQFVNRSSQTRYINGIGEYSTSWHFRIIPQQEGSYTIPAFQATFQNEQCIVPETKFTVNATQANASNQTQEDSTQAILLVAGELPSKWYVGQCCLAQIQLITDPYLHGQLASFPTKTGDCFSASKLIENPKQTRVYYKNTNKNCIYWPTLLTALKSGQHSLQFSLQLEVEKQRSSRNPFDDDPLSLFSQNLSSLFGTTEVLNVSSKPHKFYVHPLPLPQPDNFTRAIGQFQLGTPQALDKEFIQNEPLSFCVKITGGGNFDSIQAPTLNYDTELWRTYDPQSSFEAKDVLGFEGTLTFNYTLVPLKDGKQPLPTVTFCYFNPKSGNYETLTKKASTEIFIKPAIHSTPKSATMPAIDTAISGQSMTSPIPVNDCNILLDKIVWERQTSYFWAIQWLLFASVISFVLFYLRTHTATYHTQQQYKKSFRKLKKDFEQAVRRNQGANFYLATHQIIMLLLEQKKLSLTDIFQPESAILSESQLTLLKTLEDNYQACQFGQTQLECPQNISEIKQLIHTLQ